MAPTCLAVRGMCDQMGEDAALEHVRGCVQRFNVAVGGQNTPTSGYHETVTAFWIKLLSAFLQAKQPISRPEFATLAVAEYGEQKDIYRHYWDFDVVASTVARAQWMPPNLARIEATCSSPQ